MDQIQEIEITIDQAREEIEIGEALHRLLDNPDFKTVILEGYGKREAARLTMLTAEPNFTKEQREDTHQSLRAIGEFFMYLRVREGVARQARQDLDAHLNTLEEVHQEQAQGGE